MKVNLQAYLLPQAEGVFKGAVIDLVKSLDNNLLETEA